MKPEIHRIKGNIDRIIYSGKPSNSSEEFQIAIEITQIHNVPFFEKRALESLKNHVSVD